MCASSSQHLAGSTEAPVDHATRPAVSRKRARGDYSCGTPLMDEEHIWDVGHQQDPGSPLPLVNTRYRLAGGMDTPGLAIARAEENEGEYFDIGYRKRLSGIEGKFNYARQDILGNWLLDRDANGRPKVPRIPAQYNEGWSRPILQVVGGVVGKVWEFCKTNAFNGFYAGGGKGYKLSHSGCNATVFDGEGSRFWETENPRLESGVANAYSHVPGHFPEAVITPDSMEHSTTHSNTPSPRPTKRRQISDTRDELAKNWVVVTPLKRVSYATPPPQVQGAARYAIPTTSSANQRNIPSSISPRPASRASQPRRPPLHSRCSYAGNPATRANHGASYASPRSPVSTNSKIPIRSPSPTKHTRPSDPIDSPAARATQKWAALKKNEESEADESIKRLDRQLKAMIREGKEALGSKIEIDIRHEEVSGQCTPTRLRKGNTKYSV